MQLVTINTIGFAIELIVYTYFSKDILLIIFLSTHFALFTIVLLVIVAMLDEIKYNPNMFHKATSNNISFT